MKTILVPLDGSALAEQVLPHVRLLAPLMSASVQLLHVVSEADRFHLLFDDVKQYGDAGRPLGREREWEILRENGEEYLSEQAAKLRADGLEVGAEVLQGIAPEAIVDAAERSSACLIAMASHGYGGLRRWALGSVTDKVLHATRRPVLVVRGAKKPRPAPALRKIMLPLDGSPLARKALPLAAELAGATRAELMLFSVAAPPVIETPESIIAYGEFDQAVAEMRGHLVEELGPYAGELEERGVKITPIALSGGVAELIVDEAVVERVDLIVMATHGRSGLRRWALGSVADKVLHASTTPLILVNAHE